MNNQKGQIVGYVRVSSADQNLDRQIEALGEVDTMFTETSSGKDRAGRPQLKAMMNHIRSGDVVRVKSLDRLGRSTRDLLDIVHEIEDKGVSVEFVDTPALSTSSPSGTFTMTVLAAVAEMERSLIRERQAEGIALAKKRGVYQRTPKLSPDQIEKARARVNDGVPKAVIARELHVSRATLLHALNGTGIYGSHTQS